MILQALYKYYNILQNEGTKELPKEGFSVQKVSFALIISSNGELKGIMDLRDPNGKKILPHEMLVPEQKGRAGKNAPSYFLCDNVKYVLGIGDKKDLPAFNSFKELHNKYLQENNPLLKFINSFEPSKAFENEVILKYKDELEKNPNIVFKVEGEKEYLHEKEELLKTWQEDNSKGSNEITMQCLITGKIEPIARTHTPIKGVKNAQAAGASIVSFNDDSFCSYGKESSYNAPISKSAMFKYTTVLNYLLRNPKNRMFIGEDTVVFWAEKKGIYEDLLAELLNPTAEKEEIETETSDMNARNLAKDILTKYSEGIKLNGENYNIDPSTTVHILGISPNNARLAIAFYEKNSFEYFTSRIADHYNNLKIIGNEKSIPIWMILNETVIKNAKDKKISPVLSKSLMNSIFTGRLYPSSLYNAIISRIRADRDINYKRTAIIKACLIRKYKSFKIKEDITVSLNENSSSIPYQLGRLFAVLEKAQLEASNINTIKDRYFTSASATPASVFPVLLKLSLHHTAKGDRTIYFEKLKGTILQMVDEFPKHLSLDEQGEFILGYYHQTQWFYIKKEDK
ncbi:type I-C CRISPR-associated protein Cas8c/Csd1 [Clostridium sp.]|uniref:type I-C CRISPR-associated protein Cas8c/Csd1 n=1 Tax=Clostridium sp. TaxID=1506 RepID=UPI0035A19A70